MSKLTFLVLLAAALFAAGQSGGPFRSPTTPTTPAVPNFADSETPVGNRNGTNRVFTLAHPPKPTLSLQLYLNGICLQAGATHDYVLAGNTLTFQPAAATPSAPGDVLTAWYRY